MDSKNLYFIAVVPPESISLKIRNIKEEIKQKFDVKHALKLPAHITLQIPFRLEEKKEDRIIQTLLHFAESQLTFKAKLKDFDHFSNRVIFIAVTEPSDFKVMHKELQSELLSVHEFKEHEIAEKIHPHITIATRDLRGKIFPKVWAEMKDRTFEAEFEVSSLVLFKHNGKTWEILKEIRLGKN